MSTAGSEATTTTPAAPAATTETPAAAPARNKGGRPSNASKAAAAALAAAPTPAAKAVAPAPTKVAEITAPEAAPPRLPEDTVGGRKAAAGAEENAKAAAEARAAAPKAKSLDQVKAERRAKAEAEAAKAAGTGATPTAGATDEAAATAAKGKETPVDANTDAEGAAELAAKEAEQKAKDDAAAEAKKKAETVETDIPAEKLKEFTKLNRDLRDATGELRTLKADAVPRADRLKKAAELAKDGKHYEAIRALKADGIDFDKAAAEVLRLQTEEANADPETKKLRDDLAAANERLAKLEDGQTQAQKDAKETAAAAAKAQKETRIEQIVAEVTLATERFPYLSKSAEFVREALEGADEAYPLAVKHYGRPLTDEEKNGLLRAALEAKEDEHAARAKLYGVKPRGQAKPKEGEKPPAAASTTPTTTDGAMRGTVAVTVPHRKRTYAEIKAERRAGARR
jgi:hypothetical protein